MFLFLKWVVLIPAAVYLILLGLIFVFQRHLMYYPSHMEATPADWHVPEMKVLSLVTDDGLKIESWHGDGSPDQPTVVLFHGNAGTLGNRAFKARVFLDAGYGVILAGYRGFGKNEGSPHEAGLYRDARAVLGYLGQITGDIVFYGESLGSGVAVQIAYELAMNENHPLKSRLSGVILEAPFTSMGDAAAYHYPWLPARLLVWDRFDSIGKIDKISTPLLIIHGQRDRTVPAEQGKELLQAAKEPKTGLWLSDAGHVDIFEHAAGEHLLTWLAGLSPNR